MVLKGVDDDVVTTSQIANSRSRPNLKEGALFTGQLPIALDIDNAPSEIYGRILCLRHALVFTHTGRDCLMPKRQHPVPM